MSRSTTDRSPRRRSSRTSVSPFNRRQLLAGAGAAARRRRVLGSSRIGRHGAGVTADRASGGGDRSSAAPRRPATVTFGTNYSDDMPKQAFQAAIDDHRPRRHRQHHRPQQLPGEHHQLPRRSPTT